VRIRTRVAVGLATAATLIGITALATVPAEAGQPNKPCGTGATAADIAENNGVWHCDGAKWTFTENNNQANAQNAGDGSQQCNQQMIGKVVTGNQVCIQINGNFTLVVAPAGCTSGVCGQLPAEIPATCNAGATQPVTYAPGKTADCTCSKKPTGATVLVPVAKTTSDAASLPVTGSRVTLLVVGGILVLGLGTAMLMFARRRRRVSFTV
jgi:LPXTG-motif cell wall-anchored protein